MAEEKKRRRKRRVKDEMEGGIMVTFLFPFTCFYYLTNGDKNLEYIRYYSKLSAAGGLLFLQLCFTFMFFMKGLSFYFDVASLWFIPLAFIGMLGAWALNYLDMFKMLPLSITCFLGQWFFLNNPDPGYYEYLGMFLLSIPFAFFVKDDYFDMYKIEAGELFLEKKKEARSVKKK